MKTKLLICACLASFICSIGFAFAFALDKEFEDQFNYLPQQGQVE